MKKDCNKHLQKINEETIKLFFLYAEKDFPYKEEIEQHLKLTLEENNVVIEETKVGENNELLLRYQDADIIMVLVSSDLVSNETLLDVAELAAHHHAQSLKMMIPVLCRRIFGEISTNFPKINLPSGGPIANYQDKDQAYQEVALYVTTIIKWLRTHLENIYLKSLLKKQITNE